MIYRIFILCALGVMILSGGCESSSSTSSIESDSSEHNVLKEYIKTPLDKANAVSKKSDDRTQQMNRALAED